MAFRPAAAGHAEGSNPSATAITALLLTQVRAVFSVTVTAAGFPVCPHSVTVGRYGLCMAQVVPYQTVHGRRYRVRYRTPDRRQTDKRGFRTKPRGGAVCRHGGGLQGQRRVRRRSP